MSYCCFVNNAQPAERKLLHKQYHDNHYGFPLHDDNELFGRLILEINQAGLSWETILKKEAAFRIAYHNYNIAKVAGYTQKDIELLLNNPDIIRNKLKIKAAIENAKTILQLQKQFGSFENWLNQHHKLSLANWIKLFKKTFYFTGGQIVNEFLMSTGYLPGAHTKDCPIYSKILAARPQWLIIK